MRPDVSPPAFVTLGPELDLPVSGARGWLVAGGARQVVLLEFAETVEVPAHSHADQWELALAGRVELRREGRSEEHRAGDSFHVPAGQVHEATVHAGYRALIVFDEPGRYQVK